MYIYSTISSNNDAVHLTANLVSGKYTDPVLTFYDLNGYEIERKQESQIFCIWNAYEYFIKVLIPELEKFCNLEYNDDFFLPEEIGTAIDKSNIDPFELKDMLDKAISIGMLKLPKNDPFEIINKLIRRKY